MCEEQGHFLSPLLAGVTSTQCESLYCFLPVETKTPKNSQTFLLQKLIQIYYREKYTSGLNGKPGSVRLILPVSLY